MDMKKCTEKSVMHVQSFFCVHKTSCFLTLSLSSYYSTKDIESRILLKCPTWVISPVHQWKGRSVTPLKSVKVC